jgi:hypothetical protein
MIIQLLLQLILHIDKYLHCKHINTDVINQHQISEQASVNELISTTRYNT